MRYIYNLLIESSYNPFTVYRWSLLERIPEEIKFQLKNHYLSQKDLLNKINTAFGRKQQRKSFETVTDPLHLLQMKYANGDLSLEEYREKQQVLKEVEGMF